MAANPASFLVLCLSLTALPVLAARAEAAPLPGVRWAFDYDQEGRMARVTDPAGRATLYAYTSTAEGLLQSVTATPPAGPPVTWRFGAAGHLESMADAVGEVTYRYDGDDHLAAIERRGALAIRYDYDAAGRLAELRIGDVYRIAWTYDYRDRVTRLETPAGTITYAYQSGQNTVVRSLPNGIRTFWEHQPNGQLDKITHGFFAKPTDTTYSVLAEYTYARGPDGRIVAIRERSPLGDLVRGYSYDTMGRLTRATAGSNRESTYTYDLVGNRVKATATGAPDQLCTYDWAGRLTSVDGTPCAYDDCGNLAEVTVNGSARQYRYGPDGRLTEARGGGDPVRYLYDGFGRLVTRQTSAGAIRYIPDPLSSTWQPLVIEGADGKRTLVIWDRDAPLATVCGGQVEWLLHDHLSSVRLVTDARGGTKQQVDYDAFGVAEAAGATPAAAVGYAGLIGDGDARLLQTLARAYVPQLGRFLQPDPRHTADAADLALDGLYAYARSSPVEWVDRDGRSAQPYDHWTTYWASYWEDIRRHLLDRNRANQIYNQWSEQALAGARGSGIAAGLAATTFDLCAGYTGGRAANPRQSLAGLVWAVTPLGLAQMRAVQGVPRLASALGAFSLGKTAGSAAFNLGEGRRLDAALDLASVGLSVGARQTKAALGTAFPAGYQHEFPFFADTALREREYARLAEVASRTEVAKQAFGWAKLTRASASQALGWRAGESGSGADTLSPSRVGGVYLGGAGGALAGLGALRGVRTDTNGNITLVGQDGADVKLPPLRLDDLVTVFRSVYLYGEGPTVTIDPNPEDPDKSAMVIRHSQATEGSYVGWVLYQADRLMKGYTLGVDNLTRLDVVSRVPRYREIVDAIYFGAEDPRLGQQQGTWERFWIVPAAAVRFPGPRAELTLFDIPLKVRTQKMKWEKNALVDDLTGASSPAAAAFTAWFTQNYDGIAAEQYLLPPAASGLTEPVPVFAELRRIALLTAIAEKLRDQGVPMPFWMRDYEVRPVTFERFTPGLEVTRREPGRGVEARVFGGIELSAPSQDVKTYATTEDTAKAPSAARAELNRSVTLATRLEQAVTAALPALAPTPLTVQQVATAEQVFQAVAVPGAETRALNPCRLDEVDVRVAVTGGNDIRLTRSFNSFFDPQGPWGRGWALDLPRLQEVTVPLRREGSKATYATGYELLTPLNSLYARFLNGRPVVGFGHPEAPVVDAQSPFRSLASDTPSFLKDLSTRVLVLEDGREWHFTDRGDLVATTEGPQTTVYERGSAGQLTRIVALFGGRLAASIRLDYNDQGLLSRAVGKALDTPDTAPLEVAYSYGEPQRLTAVEAAEGTTDYTYAGPWVAAILRTPKEPGTQPQPRRTFEYNPAGQLTAETQGPTTVRNSLDVRADGVTASRSAETAGNSWATVHYDESMVPTKALAFDGSQTAWTHLPNGAVKTVVRLPDNSTLSVTDSPGARQRSVRPDHGPTFSADYDAGGRLTGVSEGEGQAKHQVLTQEWTPDGQLARLGTLSRETAYRYDKDAILTSVLVHPPGASKTTTTWLEARLGPHGSPVEITDSTGLDVRLGRDQAGTLTGVVQKTTEGDFGFSISRDEAGRVAAITSSWGDTSYDYAANGDLVHIKSRSGTATASADVTGGLVSKVVGFDGGVTTVRYHDQGDLAGAPQVVTCANGLQLAHGYGAAGRLDTVAVGADRRLRLEYDPRGRVRAYAWEPVAPPVEGEPPPRK
jgi:RHS repeat-associated protein